MHRARPLLAAGLLLGAVALAGCSAGSAGAPVRYVAEFALGSAEARSFLLTEAAAPGLQVLAEPSAAPLIVSAPDPGAPEPAPVSGEWPSFGPSVT